MSNLREGIYSYLEKSDFVTIVTTAYAIIKTAKAITIPAPDFPFLKPTKKASRISNNKLNIMKDSYTFENFQGQLHGLQISRYPTLNLSQ